MFYLSVHITSCWHLLVCSWSVSEDKNQPRTERHQHICCCFFFLCLSKMNRTTVTEEIYHWFLIFLSRFIMLRTVKSLMLSIFFTFVKRCAATPTDPSPVHTENTEIPMSCVPWGFNFEASWWQTYKRPICIFKVDQKATQPHLVWNLALGRFPSARDVPPRTPPSPNPQTHTCTRFPRGWWISTAMLLCQPVIRLSMPAAIVHLASDLSNPCQCVRTY